MTLKSINLEKLKENTSIKSIYKLEYKLNVYHEQKYNRNLDSPQSSKVTYNDAE